MSSKQYFDEVAHQWDSMRKGFFSENVRDTAYKVAQVQEGATAADIGAGTGFLTQGLLARKVRVIAVDQVEKMLDVLRENLSGGDLLDCRVGEAESLPIDDGAVDYVFANMFLHHVEEPPVAIKEMHRILKPGGKLVITDLDAHEHEFLRTEHNDRWMGFQRSDITDWFTKAGFKSAQVDSIGETCDSTSQSCGESASISIFVAAGVK